MGQNDDDQPVRVLTPVGNKQTEFSMLTVRGAADQLRVSSALVYALCARGRIAHERYGLGRGTIRISEDWIESYRASNRATPRPEPAAPAAPFRLKHVSLAGGGTRGSGTGAGSASRA